MPDRPIWQDISWEFPLLGVVLKDGPLFLAQQMEDKWDIFRHGEFIYFARSWTGNLVHVARSAERPGLLLINSVATGSEHIDERDQTFFIREVFFLVVSHILGTIYPHPIPLYRGDADESILQFSFSEFGRRGLYATLAGAPEEVV